MLRVVRTQNSGNSQIDLVFVTDEERRFEFNKEVSHNFNKLVTLKELGEPVEYDAIVWSLNKKQKNSKIEHIANGKEATLHFQNEADYEIINTAVNTGQKIKFVGCPLIEYGAFDPNCGDIYFLSFLGLIENDEEELE